MAVFSKVSNQVIESIRIESEIPNESFNLGAIILLKSTDTLPDTSSYINYWTKGEANPASVTDYEVEVIDLTTSGTDLDKWTITAG